MQSLLIPHLQATGGQRCLPEGTRQRKHLGMAPRGLMEDLRLSNDSRTGFFLLKFHVVIFKSRNLLLVTDFLMIRHLFVVYSFKILSLIFLIFFLTSDIFSPLAPF